MSAFMSRRAALNVSMPAELAAYVTGLVASGRYSTASEVVRTGPRLLQEKEAATSGSSPDRDGTKTSPEAH